MPRPETPSSSVPQVPTEAGRTIVDDAREAQQQGRSIFTCQVVVSVTTAAGVAFRAKSAGKVERWDISMLVGAVEALGWRLEHLDHVWYPSNVNSAGTGLTTVMGVTEV